MTDSRASAISTSSSAEPLHLELPKDVADQRVAHDVVAGPAGERDLEAAAIVGARFAGDVAGNGRRGDADVRQRQAFDVRDVAANDVGLAERARRAARQQGDAEYDEE